MIKFQKLLRFFRWLNQCGAFHFKGDIRHKTGQVFVVRMKIVEFSSEKGRVSYLVPKMARFY